MRFVLLLTVTLSSACDAAPPPPAAADLDVRGGCGDVVFYAWTQPVGPITSRVIVSYPGLVAGAMAAGETIETEVSVDDPDLRLDIEIGEQLDSACSDDGALPKGVTTFEPVGGTVRFTVIPLPAEEVAGCARASGTVSLEDVVVTAEGESSELDEVVIEATVLPGETADTGDC